MQVAVDAAIRDEKLRVLIANVEMMPRVLLDRQLARLADVDLAAIRFRRLTGADRPKIDNGLAVIRSIADRLAFIDGSAKRLQLETVMKAAYEFKANLIVLDYIQRFKSPGANEGIRQEVETAMSLARHFANYGLGVVAVSAVARQKSASGASYKHLGIASFRESSELEYGADSAWILNAGANDLVKLQCCKNRYGETPTIEMHFDRAKQRFTVDGWNPAPAAGPPIRPVKRAAPSLASLWDRPQPALTGPTQGAAQ